MEQDRSWVEWNESDGRGGAGQDGGGVDCMYLRWSGLHQLRWSGLHVSALEWTASSALEWTACICVAKCAFIGVGSSDTPRTAEKAMMSSLATP